MTLQNTAPRPPRPGTVSVPRWEDRVQHTADVLALVPGLNVPAEIVSGLISLHKKDYMGIALSVAGLIPFGGEWAVALKLAGHARTAARTVHAHSQRKEGQARPVKTIQGRAPYRH